MSFLDATKYQALPQNRWPFICLFGFFRTSPLPFVIPKLYISIVWTLNRESTTLLLTNVLMVGMNKFEGVNKKDIHRQTNYYILESYRMKFVKRRLFSSSVGWMTQKKIHWWPWNKTWAVPCDRGHLFPIVTWNFNETNWFDENEWKTKHVTTKDTWWSRFTWIVCAWFCFAEGATHNNNSIWWLVVWVCVFFSFHFDLFFFRIIYLILKSC